MTSGRVMVLPRCWLYSWRCGASGIFCYGILRNVIMIWLHEGGGRKEGGGEPCVSQLVLSPPRALKGRGHD